MALSDEQIRRAAQNERWLKDRPAEANMRVSEWLRGMAPGLDERKAVVAERMARDFEALAREAEASRSPHS